MLLKHAAGHRPSSLIYKVAAWTCVAFSSLCLNCRKLTADLGKVQAEGSQRASNEVVATTIYEGGLKPGWEDYGWGQHDLKQGAARIDFSNFGGWIIKGDQIPPNVTGLSFEMFAPSSYGQFLQVVLARGENDKSFPQMDVGPERMRSMPGGWVEVYLPWTMLNPNDKPIDRIVFHAKTKVGSNFVRFERITLTTRTGIPKFNSQQTKLMVDCRAPGKAISPYIYGAAAGKDVWDLGPTITRWGGNPTSRYNWQLGNVHNAGKDWFYENMHAEHYRNFINDNRKHGALSAITIPIIGWVSKDDSSFGFPVSKLGPQDATDPHRSDAGNGMHNGKPIRPGPPTQTSVAAEPPMMQKWVETMRAEDEKEGKRNVKLLFLDNEPNLWNSTHRDVHPDALTYDELLDRSIRYGTAIRKGDPNALIAGPAEWGWTGYFYSARDAEVGVSLRPDRRSHGDTPFIPWYLKKLREHEKTSGTRILDVLDIHYYPQGNNVYGDAADPSTAALRVRSTRSLWDPTYKDESWINDTVRLIPRLKEWINQNYPGLAISIGEYSFGGEKHISGAVAEAEALGRFGAEGVSYAFYWFTPPKNSPVYWAFRAFRNFDGKGGRFLDQSLPTRTAQNVSLFASRDDSKKHLVLIAVNLDPRNATQAQIALTGCSPITTRQKFTYSEKSPSIVDEGSKTGGTLEETLPPYSISVFDVHLQ